MYDFYRGFLPNSIRNIEWALYKTSSVTVLQCYSVYIPHISLSSHGGLQFLLKGYQINIIQITNLQPSFKSDQSYHFTGWLNEIIWNNKFLRINEKRCSGASFLLRKVSLL